MCVWEILSHVRFLTTQWTVAHQVPLSMDFSRLEYWSRLPFPPPGDLPDPGIEPVSLASPPVLTGRFFTTVPSGKPMIIFTGALYFLGCIPITAWYYPISTWRISVGIFFIKQNFFFLRLYSLLFLLFSLCSSNCIKFLLIYLQVYSCLENSMDYSPPGSSVHGIFQTRTLEEVAISSSRGSSWPRDWTRVSHIS